MGITVDFSCADLDTLDRAFEGSEGFSISKGFGVKSRDNLVLTREPTGQTWDGVIRQHPPYVPQAPAAVAIQAPPRDKRVTPGLNPTLMAANQRDALRLRPAVRPKRVVSYGRNAAEIFHGGRTIHVKCLGGGIYEADSGQRFNLS